MDGFPEIKINRIFDGNLKKLVSLRKLSRQLKSRNIATAKIKLKLKDGKIIEREFTANSGEINRLDGGAKKLDETLHKRDYFYDPFENRKRFDDTEVKIIISEIEESMFKNLDLDSAKIELEINSILKPCRVCQREIARFEKMYDAKIKVHSTEANFIRDFELLYPNYK